MSLIPHRLNRSTLEMRRQSIFKNSAIIKHHRSTTRM